MMRLLFSLILTMAGLSVASDVNFNRDIRPVLSDRCFHCHGPDEHERKEDLRLDVAEGPHGAYRTHKGVTVIHPGNVAKSELWQRITTDDEDDVMPPSDSHKKALTEKEKVLFKQWIEEGAAYDSFWAFTAPSRLAPKKVKSRSWRKGLVDPYVMAGLEARKMKPQPEADKRTLIRRVSFDLTGLPPTLEEIDGFLKDKSRDAYEDMVDRYLAKPAYGEHMARYWADLIRMADTNGMHKDRFRDFSAFREWMIRAFNDNLSFADFISYQLAGDLYPEATQDQLVASGFNRMHMIIDAGTALPEESHHKNVVDRVQAFGTAFLGMTTHCAQCHDHKYDPITQKEYYQLYAFFNNFDGEPETRRTPEGLQPPSIDLKPTTQSVAMGKMPTKAMVYRERKEQKPTHLLNRGAYDDPGDQVERGTPSFLPPMKQKDSYYTRKDLAEWLVNPGHPLTARVAVNRFWQQLFGVGLVKTAEDFGAQGEWPSHPKLLDALAVEFTESGWDLKKLMRAMVISNTYRQSSDATQDEHTQDPENRFLARGSRYRLDAEVIRDQILFVSGKLNTEMYGKSVKPPQPPGLWEAVSMEGPMTHVADKGDAIYRRSLYSFWRRAIPPPQMTLMNAPSREFCAARRERTNTPLQALLMMNEVEYFKAAGRCAQNTLALAGTDDTKGLRFAYETITSQEPSESRIKLLEDALNEFRTLYAANEGLAQKVTAEAKDLDQTKRIELAAWTMLTHSLLNLDLTKVRR